MIARVAHQSSKSLAWPLGAPLLAVKALLVNLISLLAAYGSLVLIWQDGSGRRHQCGDPQNGRRSRLFLRLSSLPFSGSRWTSQILIVSASRPSTTGPDHR